MIKPSPADKSHLYDERIQREPNTKLPAKMNQTETCWPQSGRGPLASIIWIFSLSGDSVVVGQEALQYRCNIITAVKIKLYKRQLKTIYKSLQRLVLSESETMSKLFYKLQWRCDDWRAGRS